MRVPFLELQNSWSWLRGSERIGLYVIKLGNAFMLFNVFFIPRV